MTLSGGTLSLSLVGGFQPTLGNIFLIVDNTSGSPTIGTFTNGTVIQDKFGNPYLINYAGVDLTGAPPSVGVGDIYLTALVPEPSVSLLLLSGAAGARLVRGLRRKLIGGSKSAL